MDINNKNKEYKSKSHLFYSCQYHVIFCPKYRRPVLITRAEKMENFIMMYFYYVTIFFAIAPLSLNIFWDNCLVNIINIPKPGYIGMVLLFLSIKLILNIFLVVKDK